MNFLSNFWDNFGIFTLTPIIYPLGYIHGLSYPDSINKLTRIFFRLDPQELIVSYILATAGLYIESIFYTYKYGKIEKKESTIDLPKTAGILYFFFVAAGLIFSTRKY